MHINRILKNFQTGFCKDKSSKVDYIHKGNVQVWKLNKRLWHTTGISTKKETLSSKVGNPSKKAEES